MQTAELQLSFYIVPKEEAIRTRDRQVLAQDKEEFPVTLNVQRWNASWGGDKFLLIKGLEVTLRETLAKILEDESMSQSPGPQKVEADQLEEVRAAWMSESFVVSKI